MYIRDDFDINVERCMGVDVYCWEIFDWSGHICVASRSSMSVISGLCEGTTVNVGKEFAYLDPLTHAHLYRSMIWQNGRPARQWRRYWEVRMIKSFDTGTNARLIRWRQCRTRIVPWEGELRATQAIDSSLSWIVGRRSWFSLDRLPQSIILLLTEISTMSFPDHDQLRAAASILHSAQMEASNMLQGDYSAVSKDTYNSEDTGFCTILCDRDRDVKPRSSMDFDRLKGVRWDTVYSDIVYLARKA